MAYIMDTNEEERAKGKTVEVGDCSFFGVKFSQNGGSVLVGLS